MRDAAPVPADELVIRLLGPDEADLVVRAIRSAYGDSYDVAWCYDPVEIAHRLAHGQMVSAAAFTAAGDLLGHAALTRHDHDDQVVHAGQAVSLPEARGHHVFTRVKAHLADWARARGILGIFSEATAAHPYSQRANLDLGATETGILLAWIPATVANDATTLTAPVRASVVLYHLRTNPAPAHPVYAPARHRDVTHAVLHRGGLRGRLAETPARTKVPPHSRVHAEALTTHNTLILHVEQIGTDLATVLTEQRDAQFARGVDVVFVDLRLDQPATGLVGDELADAGFGFAGIFPSPQHRGENLRLQALRPGLVVTAADVAVASDHGRALLDHVLAEQGPPSAPAPAPAPAPGAA